MDFWSNFRNKIQEGGCVLKANLKEISFVPDVFTFTRIVKILNKVLILFKVAIRW